MKLLKGTLPWVLILLFVAPAAWGQAGTTSLRGTVTDPKGAVIVGAEVTVSNPAVGFSRTTKTGSSGEYVFVQLPPATYTVTATASGFSISKVERLTLQVNVPGTLNLALAVKGQATVVEVTAAPPLINTTDATIGNAVNAEQMLNLPSEGRDPVAILSLQPGVVYMANVNQLGTSMLAADSRTGSVSGARSDQTNVTLDGLDNNDQLLGLAFQGALRTTLDSLQEFRVTTTNSNADQGRSSGAQVNMVTKSGTNKFHGTAYEYYRPPFSAANEWFIKHSQLAAGLPNIPPKILRNTFGGSVGGPIIKDRFFFFAAYEGMRKAESASVTRTIPSDTLRAGILQYPCDTTDPLCTLANPMVRDVNGTLVTTLMPADIASMETCTVSCPLGAGPNSAVLSYWTPYPSPNSDSVGDLYNLRGFTFAAPNPAKTDTYIVKLDYKLTSSGNHTLFVRGNLQNDHEAAPPQFSGGASVAFLTNNSKGIAVGYTAVLGPHLVNNFRYSFVRQGYGTRGSASGGSVINFRGIDEPIDVFARSSLVNVPVHNFVNDTSWTKGKHTIQFGTNWRFVSNNRQSDGSNFSSAVTNAYWLGPAAIAGTNTDLDPGRFDPITLASVYGFPRVDSNYLTNYDFATLAVTGILTEINNSFVQDASGNPITPGALIPRSFKDYEAEFYLQDTWRITPTLTLTGGIRYVLLQPIYERNGQQVCATSSLHQWFVNRAEGALNGLSIQPPISLDVCGNANGKPAYWGWDKKDISPRFAFAWAPNSDHGILKAIFGGGGKGSLRGGYGLYYDHFGQGITNTFDRSGSFGLTTTLTNPASVQDVPCAPRFTAPGVMPTGTFCGQNLSPASPLGAYPVTPPTGFNDGSFAIYWGMDDKLKTPYSHVFNLTYERELGSNFVLSATYQGRLGRRLLQEIDLAQPLNIKDPVSGMTYYQAASALAVLAEGTCLPGPLSPSCATPISAVQPISYWENLFPTSAGPGSAYGCMPGAVANPTATQNFYDLFGCWVRNETIGLLEFDLCGAGSCGYPTPEFLNGLPFQYWNDQFSSLYAWQSSGTASYHSLQLSLRHPMSKGLQFDFNYTYSKSIDAGSNAEHISAGEYYAVGGGASGFGGQIINAWQPKQLMAPSDYDLRHQINANWTYELPVGRGRKWGADFKGPAEAILGGWQVAGLGRWTSGFPFTLIDGSGWATNWELQGSSIQIGNTGPTGTFYEPGREPNIFKDPNQALLAFRGTRPGESGQRNFLRGPGYFGIDLAVAKKWSLGESRSLRFSWETFNLTNSVRFDAAQAAFNSGLTFGNFGRYVNTLTKPRVMQFSLRFTF